jgi:hypothetical protein
MFIHALNNGLALFSGGSLTGRQWIWYNMGDHVSPLILIGAVAMLFLGLKLFIKWTEEFPAAQPEPQATGADGS